MKHSILIYIGLALSLSETVSGQNNQADFSLTLSPNPAQYPGYPYRGTITARMTYPTNAALVPANMFSVIVTGGGAVELDISSYSPPVGWRVDAGRSRASEVVIYNDRPLTQRDEPLDFLIPTISRQAGFTFFGGDIESRDATNWYDNNTGNNVPTSFVIVDNTPLPVSLSTFEISRENSAIHLIWSTTEQFNSSHFELQHSVDANLWTEVGRVKSSGNTKDLQRYSHLHQNPSNGINYYRLRMVDLDNSAEFSEIRSISFNAENRTEIFPNPATEKLNIKSDLWDQVKLVELYNSMGLCAYRSVANPNKEINLNNLPSGMYVLRLVRVGNLTETHKITVAR